MNNINDLINWKIFPDYPWSRILDNEKFEILVKYLNENSIKEIIPIPCNLNKDFDVVKTNATVYLPKQSAHVIGLPGILITPEIKGDIDKTFKKIISLWAPEDSNSYISGEVINFESTLRDSISIMPYRGGSSIGCTNDRKIKNFLIPVQYCHISNRLLNKISK